MGKAALTLCLFIQFGTVSTGFAKSSTAPVDVKITWTYKNFPLKIKVAEITDEKQAFVSETKNVKFPMPAFVKTIFKDDTIKVPLNSSTAFTLLIENNTDQDQYFFAVPHELNPHHASAGHYFECLCNSRVFKVKAKSIWYRVVRLNLNKTFQALKKFEINHQIIGLEKNEVMLNYKERLYEDN